MVSLDERQLKQKLRKLIGRFVTTDSKRHYPQLYSVLEKINDNHYPAFLCGGAIRDVLLLQSSIPRDLDIILGNVSKEKLEKDFSSYDRKETKLGGMTLQVKDWSIDMWLIQDTWAFKEGKISGKGFSDYPKITFLDIDAIAIQLFSKRGYKRTIYTNGFFKAILNNTIEINFEENPYPAKCIVRALQIADKFNFKIGHKLAIYITSYVKKTDVEELAEIYKKRYMATNISAEKIYGCLKQIEKQLKTSNKKSVKVSLEYNGDFIKSKNPSYKKNFDLFTIIR